MNRSVFCVKNLDFDWQTNEFMLYCRSTQLREKTMGSYEQTLKLFGRWLADELNIYTVDKIQKPNIFINCCSTAEPTSESVEGNSRNYAVNTNTGKFHYPSCSSADDIAASNCWDYYGTREELIGMGYVPCKRCNP